MSNVCILLCFTDSKLWLRCYSWNITELELVYLHKGKYWIYPRRVYRLPPWLCLQSLKILVGVVCSFKEPDAAQTLQMDSIPVSSKRHPGQIATVLFLLACMWFSPFQINLSNFYFFLIFCTKWPPAIVIFRYSPKSIGFFHCRSPMAVSNMNLIRALVWQLSETQALACGGGGDHNIPDISNFGDIIKCLINSLYMSVFGTDRFARNHAAMAFCIMWKTRWHLLANYPFSNGHYPKFCHNFVVY